MTVDISLEELVKAGAHFGHQTRRWNPKMAEYIYGERDGVHVFDLNITKVMLQEALKVITQTVKDGKEILIVGTKKQAKDSVEKAAKEAGILYVTERWLGGTITNFDQIKKSAQKLTSMNEKFKKGEYASFTKKERLLIEREIEKLRRFFGGIEGISKVPDLIIVIDIKREKGAVHEANMAGIPVIAVVDSNCEPDHIDYPIPMNDDATRAIEYVVDLFKQAVLEGKSTPKKKKETAVKKEAEKKKTKAKAKNAKTTKKTKVKKTKKK